VPQLPSVVCPAGPMGKRQTHLGAAFALLFGCQRAESIAPAEPGSSAPPAIYTAAVSTSPSAPKALSSAVSEPGPSAGAPAQDATDSNLRAKAALSSAGAAKVGGCVVPLVEPSPPRAKPAPQCPMAPSISVPLTHGQVTFLDAKRHPHIDVELALEPEDQQQGLMFRTLLGADSGMLFSWPIEQVRTFWMHNTCLPLDMLFIAKDGTIEGILEQVPAMNDAPRSIPCPAAHVLEVNAGYCRKHGIVPGQHLRISTS